MLGLGLGLGPTGLGLELEPSGLGLGPTGLGLSGLDYITEYKIVHRLPCIYFTLMHSRAGGRSIFRHRCTKAGSAATAVVAVADRCSACGDC